MTDYRNIILYSFLKNTHDYLGSEGIVQNDINKHEMVTDKETGK